MSGSGGGYYRPPERTKFNCKAGWIRTVLSSLNPEALKHRKQGDLVDIEVGANETLIVIDANGELLGVVLHTNTPDIIECIKDGNNYIGEIVEVNFPACTIIVKSA